MTSQLATRTLYAPAHFGNSYEVMAPYEMRDVLREAQAWGFNGYGDWFDAADLKRPWDTDAFLLPQAIWAQKLASFRAAAALGLRCELIVTPNHVFLDQLQPEWRAETAGDHRFFGQLICPSLPEARAAILEVYRRMFADLHAAGVELAAVSGCPFDYGGCACTRCAPWILTFGELLAEIVEVAREYFPAIDARLVGWWWTAEEHAQFAPWADAAHPGLFRSLAMHLPYGATRPADATRPAGCDLHAFVHIGYGDVTRDDAYGTWGPVAAPQRLPATVHDLAAMGATGFMAYSEGVHDDVNKALLAGIASGQFADAEAVLAAYADRYFGGAGADWAAWFRQWGEPFSVDITRARRDFDRLAADATPGWRLAQWDARLRIFEAHHAVLQATAWDDRRRADAARFVEERQRLLRGIWGYGLVRHCLHPRFFPPSWWEEYERAERPAMPEEA
jgi:hypothetical protein